MFTHRTYMSTSTAVLALIFAAPLPVSAGGFYTAPANPVYNLGPEAAWMNPAGMTGVKTTAVTVGLGAALPIAEFDVSFAGAGGDDGGNAGVNGVFPAGYAVKPVGRLRLGLSILSPAGAITGTGVGYGDNFVGRYGATKAELSSTAANPTWKSTEASPFRTFRFSLRTQMLTSHGIILRRCRSVSPMRSIPSG